MATFAPMPKSQNILFVTLDTFSRMGGIQWYNRLFGKGLILNSKAHNYTVSQYSLYDHLPDELYFPASAFKGYKGSKVSFTAALAPRLKSADILVVGHINLASVALWYKRLFSQRKVIFLTHGIEVWEPLTGSAQQALQRADLVVTVSNYTREKLEKVQKVDPSKIRVLQNSLDPEFELPPDADGLAAWKAEMKLEGAKILLTVARFSKTEAAKGYDKVLELMPRLAEAIPAFKYILAGPVEADEEIRLKKNWGEWIEKGILIITGPLSTADLKYCYHTADVFALPSAKEGFGRVLIEAAWTANRVIALNAGGAPEALLNGKLGTLLNDENPDTLFNEIMAAFSSPVDEKTLNDNRDLIQKHFGFDNFVQHQNSILKELYGT